MATCDICGARITWLATVNEQVIPVDEDPDPSGNIVVLGSGRCTMLGSRQGHDGPRYMRHEVTCRGGEKGRAS